MTVSAVRPWRTALQRERSLPSGVVGPVLLSALRRLASICLSELIDDQKNWVCFVKEGSPLRLANWWIASIAAGTLASAAIWARHQFSVVIFAAISLGCCVSAVADFGWV